MASPGIPIVSDGVHTINGINQTGIMFARISRRLFPYSPWLELKIIYLPPGEHESDVSAYVTLHMDRDDNEAELFKRLNDIAEWMGCKVSAAGVFYRRDASETLPPGPRYMLAT